MKLIGYIRQGPDDWAELTWADLTQADLTPGQVDSHSCDLPFNLCRSTSLNPLNDFL